MNLTLTVLKSPPGGETAAKTFEAAIGNRGATIGRQSDNDWVLAGDTALSRRHCRIVCENGEFAIIDTSSFGSEVNGRKLTNGQRLGLRDGDMLVLGAYEMSVTVDAMFEQGPAPSDFSQPLPFSDFSNPDFSSQPTEQDVLSPPLFASQGNVIDDLDLQSLRPRNTPFADPLPPDAATLSGYLSAEREAFPVPHARKILPDDADIFGDLAPSAKPERPSAPEEGLVEFLRGAGLRLIPERNDSSSTLRSAGETFRAAVEGIREILVAREQFKTEFRLDKTEFGADQNNPVKPKLPLEDALAAMILGRRGFMPGPDAMHEALEDIKAHEMALIAGLQVALTHLLEQLAPERLEKRIEKRSLFDSLPGLRKAKLWQVYETMHAEIARELEEDFQGSFGRAFAEAYGKYVRRSRGTPL